MPLYHWSPSIQLQVCPLTTLSLLLTLCCGWLSWSTSFTLDTYSSLIPQSKRNQQQRPLKSQMMVHLHNMKKTPPSRITHPPAHSLTPLLFTLRSYNFSSSHLAMLLQSTRSILAALSIFTFSIRFTPAMSGLQYSNTISCSTTAV